MGEAGASARAEVERARRQLAATLSEADRLARRIEGFEAGEEGERTTAGALSALPGGFSVHHDLHIEGSEANIDHVVVGPTGVYVIDSKHWTGPVSIGNGTLRSGRHPQRRALVNLSWETACVAAALAATDAVAPVPVISVTGSGRGDRALEIGGTWVLPVEMLNDFLTAGPSRLTAEVVERAAHALSGPRVPRAPYPGADRPRSPQRHAARSAPKPPRGSHSGGRPTRTRPVRANRALQLGVGLLAILAVGAVVRHLPHRAYTSAASAPVGVTPTPASPGPLHVSWSCSDPSAGWTATFVLSSGEQAALGTWVVQVATSQDGPWTTEASGEGEMRMTGMQPDRTGWIRGGNISSIEIAGRPLIEGRVTTPAGC